MALHGARARPHAGPVRSAAGFPVSMGEISQRTGEQCRWGPSWHYVGPGGNLTWDAWDPRGPRRARGLHGASSPAERMRSLAGPRTLPVASRAVIACNIHTNYKHLLVTIIHVFSSSETSLVRDVIEHF